MKKTTSILLILLLFGLYHCATAEKLERARINPYWNDLALFLAGMPQRPESPFREPAATPQYARHVDTMNTFWERVRGENLGGISKWREAQLRGLPGAKTAFYPFSGADLANLYTFYPEAQTYVMIALESAGPIPDPLLLSPAELGEGLSSIHRAIRSIASRNYFHSAVMQRELPNRYLPGTLPVLLIFASRLNLQITAVELIGIDKSGRVTPLDAFNSINGAPPNTRGARIQFTAPGDTAIRSLVYLDMRLSDSVLDPSSPEGKFFERMGGFDTLIKSAVYLLHNKGFAGLCSYILEHSATVIQDDSGMPFRLFDRADWDARLFGTYTRPRRLKDLQNPPNQPDLTLAYNRKSEPLPFNFGYGVLTGKGKSNLLLAVRRKDR
ncbi:MAG TPA: hypothetical protein PLZ78_03195 [Spirochaetota bacterium]|nr:hypothetical protein [Spirochaetota bacterium]